MDFILLSLCQSQSYTGKTLAESFVTVLDEFGISDKVSRSYNVAFDIPDELE